MERRNKKRCKKLTGYGNTREKNGEKGGRKKRVDKREGKKERERERERERETQSVCIYFKNCNVFIVQICIVIPHV